MPRRTTIVLALVLLTIGAELHYHYFYIEQYALILLIAISIVIFVCSVLMSFVKTRSVTYKDSLVCAVVVIILCGFTYESVAGNKRKNQKYLEKLAGIINRYTEKNQKLPVGIEEALEPWEVLPNRGDADGNSCQYIKLSDRVFVLRTLGANQKYEFGAGDDVQLNYLYRNSVSFEELSSWIAARGTPDEQTLLELYFPASQRSR